MRFRYGLVTVCAVAVLLAGCGSTDGDGDDDHPQVRPAWQPVTLPVPPGPPGRLMLRDASACAGRWYVVGAVGDTAGGTRPAAWTSSDASAWTPVRVTARTQYGAANVLTAVGCRDGRMAAVGARSGGVHGNPRVSTWRQSAGGALEEVLAEFELYGGPDAVNVGRIAGGPAGWLIAGNRSTGAAAWVSPDAAGFQLVSRVPGFVAEPGGRIWAADVTPVPTGWLLIGSVSSPGRTDEDPTVWTSSDGLAWQRSVLSGSEEHENLRRVARLGDRPVAVGQRGDGFGAWIGGPVKWRRGGTFARGAAGGLRDVGGLTSVSGGVLAVVADGPTASMWFSGQGESWSSVVAPVELRAGADRTVVTAGEGDSVLLVVDDGRSGAVWSARIPQGDR